MLELPLLAVVALAEVADVGPPRRVEGNLRRAKPGRDPNPRGVVGHECSDSRVVGGADVRRGDLDVSFALRR